MPKERLPNDQAPLVFGFTDPSEVTAMLDILSHSTPKTAKGRNLKHMLTEACENASNPEPLHVEFKL